MPISAQPPASALRREAERISHDVVQLRHDLHRYPEIGLELPHTQRAVLDALSGLDLEISTGRAITSVTAVLRGCKDTTAGDDARPVVLLRGDMDALPVQEQLDLDFRSTRAGIMHGCGHDLHTAMLVGAAHTLSAIRDDLAGDVVFMFQPGEEGYDGAAVMIDEGVLDAAGRRADSAWALHVMSGLAPTGTVLGRPGPMLASSSELEVVIHGRGGHASAPHRARDPIPAACEMVLGLQTLLSRTVDPFQPVVLTVGQLHAGSRPNIIPADASFGATFRCFDMGVLDQVKQDVLRYCHRVADAHGVGITADFALQYPITVNDPGCINLAESVVTTALGEGRFTLMPFPITGAEDFSRVVAQVPGAMLFLGASTAGDQWATSADNHSPNASFSDDVLTDGVQLYAELATAALAEHAQTDHEHQPTQPKEDTP